VITLIEKLYGKDKYLEKIPAVTKEQCNRCQGNNIYEDIYGQLHCLDCYEYGEVNDQMSIYRYERTIPLNKHLLEMGYSLTAIQEKGSKFLVDCYENSQSGFLQAVCGAGKTEMTFAVILTALNNGQRVCFVIPRVAVLKEVFARLKKHFPRTEIKMLLEGNKDYNNANLIVSTPQQLIYFYSEFDLVIVDEVDAFPLAGNKFLKRLIIKSLKPYGVILYMSATIDLRIVNDPAIRQHLIPSRFHRRPLVVPEIIRMKSRKDMTKLIEMVDSGDRQVLIFIPTIQIGEELLTIIKKSGIKTDFISSKSKYKDNSIRAFRNQEYRILLCTTILERGVTFQDIDCVVLMADHPVFTKDTLIQIAGRVGRLPQFIDGSVRFYSKGITKEMAMAIKEIIWMNRKNEMSAV